ncbi:hypothetical protein KCV87_30710 [Actinosynnema pretiosum subsp. pretiosum]|uniref:Uncharacterized protein n=2 Tax=Actinosynnema TaxID=40566 RepID=C6WQS7_ACTMD|nr:hypothetical protein [Actinosynnema mirum]ACU38767.1 hypothetical protein Amir_4941 [Actinosynnema mirum DSM 43827]AXX32364.1 hypothetical protein APASM_4999 [Actinosynnema pretiosum subsp. pretiosum]QUF03696.1 hypothetical protein KCV87_30710 [Actinosynnema pretiosum subsp. pretiosum]
MDRKTSRPPRRTPQEKKRLSYAKDGRNTYGQHDKASRRGVRRRKATAHRAHRHSADRVLRGALGAVDPERADLVGQDVQSLRRKPFAKAPDTPLGEFVEARLRRRVALGVDAEATALTRIAHVRGRRGLAA